MARTGFSFRVFTSFVLFWAFLALMISGAVLYVAPPGRIANWTRWQLMILTKEQWQAVHTLTAVTFLIGGLFHLLKFNWKAFLAYLKRKTETQMRFRYEMLFSLGLFGVILAGTLAEQPPFSTVMTGAETIRSSWEGPSGEPPMAHMEDLTLQEVARDLQLDPEKFRELLQAQGMTASRADETLKELAERYHRSPQQVYEEMQKRGNPASSSGAAHSAGSGRGQGYKTVAELAAEHRLTPSRALELLRAGGIEATAQETVRDVATRHNRKPYELIEILKGEGNK